jgi:hypothetical protein
MHHNRCASIVMRTARSHQELAFPGRPVGADLTDSDFAAYAGCLAGLMRRYG